MLAADMLSDLLMLFCLQKGLAGVLIRVPPGSDMEEDATA